MRFRRRLCILHMPDLFTAIVWLWQGIKGLYPLVPGVLTFALTQKVLRTRKPGRFVCCAQNNVQVVDVYVLKRPHMDAFMEAVGAAFEVVVFTASLAKYADPLLDLLDRGHVVQPCNCRLPALDWSFVPKHVPHKRRDDWSCASCILLDRCGLVVCVVMCSLNQT